MAALSLTTVTYYYNADCSAFSNTTWVATVVGTATLPLRKIYIETTCDQPLEWGYTSGTGSTAAGLILGMPKAIVWDLELMPFVGTLYFRKRAGGTTPTANTLLTVSGVG